MRPQAMLTNRIENGPGASQPRAATVSRVGGTPTMTWILLPVPPPGVTNGEVRGP